MTLGATNRREYRTAGGDIDRGRRRILRTSGMIVAAAAGIPVGSADEHDDEFTEEEILTLLELTLDDLGVEVAELEIDGGVLGTEILSLDYYPLGTTEEEVAEEMGYITGAFAEAIELGLEVERLETTALDVADEPVSRWHVETEWAEAYNDGEMTANQLSLEALATLEPIGE